MKQENVDTSILVGDISNNGGIVVAGVGNTVNAQLAKPLFIGVPVRPRPLFGREALITNVKEALFISDTAGGMFALDGMPGVGKTTLVAHLVYDQEVQKHFAGGILWVGLGQTGDAESTLGEWAIAIGLDFANKQDVESKVRKLQAALPATRTLIILDDVWPETLLAALLLCKAAGAKTTFLITSRDETITRRLAGKRAIKIKELDDDAAVELLTSYCPPAAGMTERLLRLAHRVGNLPLALALVGGHLAGTVAFTDEVEQVLEGLSRTEVWLGITDAEHTLSLTEVIGKSVAALGSDEAKSFARLGTFAPKPSTFSRVAAAKVAAAELAFISRLVLVNLIEKVDEESVMMHQTIAAVAEAQAQEQGTLSDAQEEHAQHYLTVMRESGGDWQRILQAWPQINHAWAWLSGADDYAPLALQYIDAAWGFQDRYGLRQEQLAWCERGLALSIKPLDRSNLLNQLGNIYSAFGDNAKAIACYEQSLALRRSIGFSEGIGATLGNIGLVWANTGEYKLARSYYDQALVEHQQNGFWHGEATILNNIGSIHYGQGHYPDALTQYLKAFEVVENKPLTPLHANIIGNIGNTYAALGRTADAQQTWQAAVIIAKTMGERSSEATNTGNLASYHYRRGEYQAALEYLEQALVLHEELGNRSQVALIKRNLGSCSWMLGKKEKARQLMDEALKISHEVGDIDGEADCLNSLGKWSSDEGNERQALGFYAASLKLARRIGDQAGQVTTLLNMAKSNGELGELDTAYKHFTQALELARRYQQRKNEVVALNGIGKYHYDKDERTTARQYYEQGLAIAKEIEEFSLEGLLSYHLARTYLDDNELDTARAYFKQALSLGKRTQYKLLIEQAEFGLNMVLERRRGEGGSLGRIHE